MNWASGELACFKQPTLSIIALLWEHAQPLLNLPIKTKTKSLLEYVFCLLLWVSNMIYSRYQREFFGSMYVTVPSGLGISILCFFIDCTFLFFMVFCPHPHWKMLEIMGIFRCSSPFLFTNKYNWNFFMSSWPYTKQSPKDKGSIGVHENSLSILIVSNGDLNFY